MWYLYLDESGDLGFENKSSSKYFTITILCFQGRDINREIALAVSKTLSRKINYKYKKGQKIHELKGTHTSPAVKQYLYERIKHLNFSIYAITLDKKKIKHYWRDKAKREHLYNYVSRLVLEHIPFENTDNKEIQLSIDKSKSRDEIEKFNNYIRQHLQSRIAPHSSLDIQHYDSRDQKGLQLADLFCWGIFQKYERNRAEWFDIFKEKILYDQIYLG